MTLARVGQSHAAMEVGFSDISNNVGRVKSFLSLHDFFGPHLSLHSQE